MPSHILAVGRELWIGVVAHIVLHHRFVVDGLVLHRLGRVYFGSHKPGRLTQVAGLARGCVIEINVGVGRDGIVTSCLLAASVSHLFGIGAPCQLLYAAKRFHGAFVGFTLKHVFAFLDAVCCNLCHIRMLYAFHIVVPMAEHQVSDQSAGSLGQVGRILLDDVVVGERLDEYNFGTVGREDESLHAILLVRELLAVCAVGQHGPHLSFVEIGDALATLNPGRVGLVLGTGGKLALVLAVGIHHAYYLMASVFLHTVVAYLVDHLFAVGRWHNSANSAHCPKCFRCHQVTFERDIALADVHIVLCLGRYAATHGHGCGNS